MIHKQQKNYIKNHKNTPQSIKKNCNNIKCTYQYHFTSYIYMCWICARYGFICATCARPDHNEHRTSSFFLISPLMPHICVNELGQNWFATNHFLNQRWLIVNWTIMNKFKWNLYRNSNTHFQETALENVICEMAAIVSFPGKLNMGCVDGGPGSVLIHSCGCSSPMKKPFQISCLLSFPDTSLNHK